MTVFYACNWQSVELYIVMLFNNMVLVVTWMGDSVNRLTTVVTSSLDIVHVYLTDTATNLKLQT